MAHQVPHVSISYFTSDYSSSEPSLFLAQALVILVSFKLPKHVKLSPSSRSLHMVSPSAGRIAGSFSFFPVSSEKPPPMMLSRLFLCPVPHPHSVPKYSLALCSLLLTRSNNMFVHVHYTIYSVGLEAQSLHTPSTVFYTFCAHQEYLLHK